MTIEFWIVAIPNWVAIAILFWGFGRLNARSDSHDEWLRSLDRLVYKIKREAAVPQTEVERNLHNRIGELERKINRSVSDLS